MGLAAPLLFAVFVAISSIILNFVTREHLDARLLLPELFPPLKFTEWKGDQYWVVVDTFYYKLKKAKTEADVEYYHWLHACDRSISTWYFVTLVLLAVLFSVSLLTEQLIVGSVHVSSCTMLPSGFKSTCFQIPSLQYVNCTENETELNIICLRFLRFGSDTRPVFTIISSLLLYFVCTQIFKYIMSGVKVLQHFYSSKYWGVLILVFGITCLLVLIGYTYIIFSEMWQSDLNTVFQAYVCCFYLIVTGLFLLHCKWVKGVHDLDKEIEEPTSSAMPEVIAVAELR